MTPADSELCFRRLELSHQVAFPLYLVLRAFFAGVGAMLMCLQCKKKFFACNYHSNARIILLTHFIFVLLSAIAVLVNSVIYTYFFYVENIFFDYPSHRCPISVDYNSVYPTYYLNIFANNAAVLTFAALAIERCYSTAKSSDYENSGKLLGICLSLIMTALAFLSISLGLIAPSLSIKIRAIVVLFSLAGTELISIFILLSLYACNGAWRHSEYRWLAGLSQKYQVTENVELIKFIVPIAIAHIICTLSTCVLLPIGLLFFETRLPPTMYFDFFPLYYVVLPLLLYLKTDKKSRNDRRWEKIKSCESDPSTVHHQQLQIMFSSIRKPSLTKIKIQKSPKSDVTKPEKFLFTKVSV